MMQGYSWTKIWVKLQEKLGYTMKVTSTVAYQASQSAIWIIVISIGPGLGHVDLILHVGNAM